MKECVFVEIYVMKIPDRRLRIFESLKISDFSNSLTPSTPSNTPIYVGLLVTVSHAVLFHIRSPKLQINHAMFSIILFFRLCAIRM